MSVDFNMVVVQVQMKNINCNTKFQRAYWSHSQCCVVMIQPSRTLYCIGYCWCKHRSTCKPQYALLLLHLLSSLSLIIETLNTTCHTWIIPHTLLSVKGQLIVPRSLSELPLLSVLWQDTEHKKITAQNMFSLSKSISRRHISLLSVCVRHILPHKSLACTHALTIFSLTLDHSWRGPHFFLLMQGDLLSANDNTLFHTCSAEDSSRMWRTVNPSGSHCWLGCKLYGCS